MNESEYDKLKQFADIIKGELSFDLKLHVNTIRQLNKFMQMIMERRLLNQNNPASADIEKLYELSQDIVKHLDSTDEKIFSFIEYAQMISKKHPK